MSDFIDINIRTYFYQVFNPANINYHEAFFPLHNRHILNPQPTSTYPDL